MLSVCVPLLGLTISAAALLPEEPPLKDEEVLRLVYDNNYRVPKGFYADPALKDPNRSLYFHQDGWFADEKDKARKIVEEFLARPSGIQDKKIAEETETRYSFDFRAGNIVFRVHKPGYFAWKGKRAAEHHNNFPQKPVEIGTFNPREISKDAVRAFAEYEWNMQNYNMGGAKVLSSATREEDGKIVHVLVTTAVVYGDFGLQDEITVGEISYVVDKKDGSTIKSARTLKQLKGKRN